MEGCYPIQTGVVELYLAEFLGLDETEDVKDALGKHVALQNVLSTRGKLVICYRRRPLC